MLQYVLVLSGALLFGLGVELRPRGRAITYGFTFGLLQASTTLGKTLGYVGIALWVASIFLGPLWVSILLALATGAIVIGLGELWLRRHPPGS